MAPDGRDHRRPHFYCSGVRHSLRGIHDYGHVCVVRVETSSSVPASGMRSRLWD